jgi:hypothetical protein
MNLIILIYTGLLFFVLTPNILLKIPNHGSTLKVAIVHGLVFAVIFYFTKPLVWNMSEGFQSPPAPSPPPSSVECSNDNECPNGSVCNNITKICVVTKLLPTGASCNRSRICANGCNIDIRQCL